jgi:hypothetical protein
VDFQNTPSRWWANHKVVFRTWDNVKQAIKYKFQNKKKMESEMQKDLQVAQCFNGESYPRMDIEQCMTQWQVVGIPSHF